MHQMSPLSGPQLPAVEMTQILWLEHGSWTFLLVLAVPCIYILAAGYVSVVTWLCTTALVSTVLYNIIAYQKHQARIAHAKNRAVLITGCDTGFGNRLARHLDSLGEAVVFACCLNVESEGGRALAKETSGRVHVMKLDVTSDQDAKQTRDYVVKILRQENLVLWAVVNNAGLLVFMDAELTPMAQSKQLCDVNYLGVVRVTTTFLPLIRKSKGRIVIVSSVTAHQSTVLTASYCASKRAVEGYADALRMEMKRFDVAVVLVEPGNFVNTTNIRSENHFDKQLTVIQSTIDPEVVSDYGERYIRSIFHMLDQAAMSSKHADSARVVQAMVDALYSAAPKTRYWVHGGAGNVDAAMVLVYMYNWLPTCWYDCVLSQQLRWLALPDVLKTEASRSDKRRRSSNRILHIKRRGSVQSTVLMYIQGYIAPEFDEPAIEE